MRFSTLKLQTAFALAPRYALKRSVLLNRDFRTFYFSLNEFICFQWNSNKFLRFWENVFNTFISYKTNLIFLILDLVNSEMKKLPIVARRFVELVCLSNAYDIWCIYIYSATGIISISISVSVTFRIWHKTNRWFWRMLINTHRDHLVYFVNEYYCVWCVNYFLKIKAPKSYRLLTNKYLIPIDKCKTSFA